MRALPVLLTLLLVGVATCAKDPALSGDAATDAVIGADKGSAIDKLAGSDVSADRGAPFVDASVEVPADAPLTPPADVQFPAPPEISCGGDGGDCPIPVSACADPVCSTGSCTAFQWMVYYDNPQCVAGRCVFEQRYFMCQGSDQCFGGGCLFNGTAAP